MGDVFDNAYIPDPAMRADRLASPAGAADTADLTGIAPALVLTCELDRLRGDGVAYAHRLRAAGALLAHVDLPGRRPRLRHERPRHGPAHVRTHRRAAPRDILDDERTVMTITDNPTAVIDSIQFPPGRLFIGGEWREAADGGRRDVISPATGRVISSVAWAATADVDAAVAAARESFDSGVWSRLSGRERSRVLLKAVEILRERREELAQLESHDVGKPITFARIVDVEHAILQFEYAASLGQHLDGSVREIPANAHAYIRKEPIGVVAAITPFNFPLILS